MNTFTCLRKRASELACGLWDMDGTVCSSEGVWHGMVIAEAIARTNAPSSFKKLVTPEFAQAAYNGPGHGADYYELLGENLFRANLGENFESALTQFRKSLPEVSKEFEERSLFKDLDVPCLPGFVDAFHALDLPSVIVTMTPSYLARAILSRANVFSLFEEVYGCELFLPSESHDPQMSFQPSFMNKVKGLRKHQATLWESVAQYHFSLSSLKRVVVAEDGSSGAKGAIAGQVGLLLLLHRNCLSIPYLDTVTSFHTEENGNWHSLT